MQIIQTAQRNTNDPIHFEIWPFTTWLNLIKRTGMFFMHDEK